MTSSIKVAALARSARAVPAGIGGAQFDGTHSEAVSKLERLVLRAMFVAMGAAARTMIEPTVPVTGRGIAHG
jgi:hypothetical protein